jgi:hypothetical protein
MLALLAWAGAALAQPAPWVKYHPAQPADAPGDVDGSLATAAPPAESNWRPGLVIGLPTLLRLQRAFADDGRNAWVGEGFVGLEVIFPMAGVGIRRRFTPARGEHNCLRISPGIDVAGLPWAPTRPLLGDNPGAGALLSADVDIAWERSWGRCCGSELGIKVGGSAVLGGHGSLALPVIGLFGGLHF